MGYISTISIIGACLSFLYNFLPNDTIVDLIFNFDSEDEIVEYDDTNF